MKFYNVWVEIDYWFCVLNLFFKDYRVDRKEAGDVIFLCSLKIEFSLLVGLIR